jgi:hypothetical protein
MVTPVGSPEAVVAATREILPIVSLLKINPLTFPGHPSGNARIKRLFH